MKTAATTILAFLALPSVASAKEPRFTEYSARTVTDLAGCVALKLADARGYEVQRRDLGGGVELQLKYRVAGIAATAATFLVEEAGERRRLTVYATGKSSGAPRQIAETTKDCIG